MKQKKHTQNEKIARLEKVLTQLYLRQVELEKTVQTLKSDKDGSKENGQENKGVQAVEGEPRKEV